MIIRHHRIVDRINRRNQRMAEQKRMLETVSAKPLYWLLLVLALLAFFTAPR